MTILRRAIRDRRRTLLWWMLGFLALDIVTLAFYPSIRGQQNFDEVIRQMPEALRTMFGMADGVSLASAPGYLWVRLFSSLFTVLLVVYAIVGGAGTIGGAEEDGTLELLLANPVSRRSVALQRAAALALALAALAAFAAASLVVLAPPFSALEGVDLPGLAAAFAGALSLALLHAAVAFAGGAISGRRGPGLAAGTVLAAGGFLAQGLLSAASAPLWLRNLDPWYWYLERNLLAFGPRWEAVVPSLMLSLLPLVLGIAVFQRRDLR